MVKHYTTGYRPNKITGKYEAYKMQISQKRAEEIAGWWQDQYGDT
jgi:hypothetical protein